MSDKQQCNAAVYKRDTYRVARGTKSGFRMHYDRKQCSRVALDGCEFCRQHQSASDKWGGVYLELYRRPPPRRRRMSDRSQAILFRAEADRRLHRIAALEAQIARLTAPFDDDDVATLHEWNPQWGENLSPDVAEALFTAFLERRMKG